MKILLIAGHGGTDPGAIGCGYKEADLTREMVVLLKPELERYANVTVADTSVDWYTKIAKQGVKLSAAGYDYVLEIHFNAAGFGGRSDGVTTGTEIYVTNAEKSVVVEQAIVDRISLLGIKNRGVKRCDYAVINHIKKQGVSSALLEVCFIDDADDMSVYINKKNEIVKSIAFGISVGFGLLPKEDVSADEPLPNKSEVEEVRYQKVEHLPDWARPTVEKLILKGFLKGNENDELDLSGDMVRILVVLDRAGAYGK
jgi:N-acetylmuramoyl-L-alanine amidase